MFDIPRWLGRLGLGTPIKRKATRAPYQFARVKALRQTQKKSRAQNRRRA